MDREKTYQSLRNFANLIFPIATNSAIATQNLDYIEFCERYYIFWGQVTFIDDTPRFHDQPLPTTHILPTLHL